MDNKDKKIDEFPAISVQEYLQIKITERNEKTNIVNEKVCINSRMK